MIEDQQNHPTRGDSESQCFQEGDAYGNYPRNSPPVSGSLDWLCSDLRADGSLRCLNPFLVEVGMLDRLEIVTVSDM